MFCKRKSIFLGLVWLLLLTEVSLYFLAFALLDSLFEKRKIAYFICILDLLSFYLSKNPPFEDWWDNKFVG